MPFRLEARGQHSMLWSWLSPVIAIVATLIVSTALFAAMGKPAGDALYTFVVAPISSLNGLAELGVKAAPLVLIGVGLAIGFRANVWNIGAEGQLILGAIVGGGVGLAAGDSTGFWILPAMILGGAFGGALWAAIPALLKTRFNASEILTSLMLTYVAQLLLIYLVVGPWKDPEGYGFPQTRLFGDDACTLQLTRDFFTRTRSYKCAIETGTMPAPDLTRAAYIIDHSTETLLADQVTQPDGSVTRTTAPFSLPDRGSVPACEAICKTRAPHVNTAAAPAGVTGAQQNEPSSFDTFYHVCDAANICPAGPGEEIVSGCGCLDDFPEAVVMMQSVRLAGADMVCTSATP